MNILITGANGFLGREFVRLLQNTEHNILATTRDNLDVSDSTAVDQFFINNKIDIVLHTAFIGVKNSTENSVDTFITNLDMHRNLSNQASKFKLMFSFGSGAAFDRDEKIEDIFESQLHSRHPADFYGKAKNIIARHINKHHDNIINLRLFGCFGPLEDNTRLIMNSITQATEKQPIIIHQDKKMDFFYVNDLFKVIMFYAKNYKETLPKDLNMCYEHKTTLAEIANHIKNLTESEEGVIIKKKDFAPAYTGAGATLASLNLKLRGLEEGIREVYEFHRR
jgi:nucleoside-diphosphate-sugar epimerase